MLDDQEVMTPAREQRLRRLATKRGYSLRKSRVRNPHIDDHGGYRIVDPWTNCVIAGEKFDLVPSDVEALLTDQPDEE